MDNIEIIPTNDDLYKRNRENFRKELREVINRNNIDNMTNMHDFVLAEFICNIIDAVAGSVYEEQRLRS